MAPIHRILVILDPCAQPTAALEKGAGLARALHAELWLGRFGRKSDIGHLDVRDRELLQRLDAYLQGQIAGRLRELAAAIHDEYQVKVHSIDEDAPVEVDRIVECIAAHRIDLVVKDAQQVPALRRLLFAPLDWDLLRSCPVPLWLAGTEDSALPARVATAVDPLHEEHGAKLNPSILGMATAVANAAGAELRVLTCYAGMPTLAVDPETPATLSETVDRELRSRHRDAFNALLKAHGIAAAQGTMLEGMPAEALVRAAREGDVDLLVIGTMRRRGVARLLMGNTAERLCTQAPCDLLAVPDLG